MKLTWKELKKLLTDNYETQDLMLGSNKSDNSKFDNFHTPWKKGTKKELLEYINEVKKHGAVEVFVYHQSDHNFFYTVWNSLEGYFFQK